MDLSLSFYSYFNRYDTLHLVACNNCIKPITNGPYKTFIFSGYLFPSAHKCEKVLSLVELIVALVAVVILIILIAVVPVQYWWLVAIRIALVGAVAEEASRSSNRY